MALKKNDFIEIDFTGFIADTNEIFDTTKSEDAKKANLDTKNIKSFKMAVSQKMLPAGFDKDLEGKEIGQSYKVTLEPEDAFGKRNPQMIRMIPTKYFYEQQINPVRGMQLALDGQLVKVLSSDKGRTLVDFNNPLAGKKIKYEYTINKEITNEKEKVDALQEFLFRRIFESEIKEGKVIFKIEKEYEPFVKMFAPKFKEILNLEIDTKIVEKEIEKNEN